MPTGTASCANREARRARCGRQDRHRHAASITARRTPRYDSTWYIPGTFNIVVDASALFYRRLLLPIVAGLPQQPDAMLAMVAGHRDELVQNPAFLPLR